MMHTMNSAYIDSEGAKSFEQLATCTKETLNKLRQRAEQFIALPRSNFLNAC